MVRAYKVKGEKRKKKGENYDKEEIEEHLEEEPKVSEKRAKMEHTAADTEAAERVVDLLAGIPVVATDQTSKPGVIFIVERASLEIAKIGKVCLSVYAMSFGLSTFIMVLITQLWNVCFRRSL